MDNLAAHVSFGQAVQVVDTRSSDAAVDAQRLARVEFSLNAASTAPSRRKSIGIISV
jgi:hypothetical protein